MYIYIYIYIYREREREREIHNKNVTNANCFRFGDPFLISKKDSYQMVSYQIYNKQHR